MAKETSDRQPRNNKDSGNKIGKRVSNNSNSRGHTEAEIQHLIIAWLRTNNIFIRRINTTGVFDSSRGYYRALTGIANARGMPDLIGILPEGRFLAIEVKTPRGKVSNEQCQVIDEINDAGGMAFVARSLDDVKGMLCKYIKLV